MSHLASSSNEVLSATTITVDRPAGAGAAHVMRAAVWADTTGAGGITAPGWTRILTITHTSYGASELAIFKAPGDVAGLTFNLPVAAGSGGIRALVSAFAGRDLADAGGDIQVAESTGTTTSIPSLTLTADSDVFAVWGDWQANLSGPITGGAPSGFTDRLNDNTPVDLHSVGATAEGLAAGVTGALSRACGNFTAKLAAGVVIAAAGGGGGGGTDSSCLVMVL